MDVLILIMVLAVMCDSLTPGLAHRPLAWLARDSHAMGNFLLLVSVYIGSKLLPDAEAQRRKEMRTT